MTPQEKNDLVQTKELMNALITYLAYTSDNDIFKEGLMNWYNKQKDLPVE